MAKKIFFQKADFGKIKNLKLNETEKLRIISEMIRYNTLTEVMAANSGHLGTSLSMIEAIVALYYKVMKIFPKNPSHQNRDIFILSKGHAGPSLYAVLASLGYFDEKHLGRYRRLHGLEGHIDIKTPGIEVNTGSLGMGISKGKGFALVARRKKINNKIFVLLGDGEMQEGQNYEALQTAPTWKLGNLVLLIDKNQVQSDQIIDKYLPMAPLDKKLASFGWKVISIDGHNIAQILKTLSSLNYKDEKPKAIILNTIKGRGISFMEFPENIKKFGKFIWHDKVPSVEEYKAGAEEVILKIKNILKNFKVKNFYPIIKTKFERPDLTFAKESVVDGYSRGLMDLGKRKKEIVVLDGDLSAPCGLRPFEKTYPQKFVEVGIAEQDMVSIAGGFARKGFMPIVNTFTAFLTSRANEQIFNNFTENTKIIYAGHLAGLIPATPGKSHQAVRDIALMRTLPGITIFEPANAYEAQTGIKYLYEKIPGPSYLRLANIKGLAEIAFPKNYKVSLGKGTVLKNGADAAIISYGPIMLSQALQAAEILKTKKINVKVINMPWLSHIDKKWFKTNILPIKNWFVIDDHLTFGGLGEEIKKIIEKDKLFKNVKINIFSVEDIPCTGWVMETLKFFKLDGASIAKKIIEKLK